MAKKLKLPKRFKKILKKDNVCDSIVQDVITVFKPIYLDNKLFFFDEYTDHGIDHIERVLKAADFIITDDSFEKMNAKEVMILVLGVILHDLGMQMEFSTFKALLDGKYDEYRIEVIDNKTWKQLWDEYLAEVKRFSSIKNNDIFGSNYKEFKSPDLSDKDKLDGYDKKLIGEFVRRHHARFAHEVALAGIHGEGDKQNAFGNDEKIKKLHRDLIGVLARSHGMNIRDTFGCLEELDKESCFNPDEINIIFLMVVLRIADCIQIDDSRVNLNLLKLKIFNSPVSMRENNAHLDTISVNFKNQDNEKIHVLCEPKSSEMFVKLDGLFKYIQNELDTSWAVLGEVYSFLPADEKPRIKFRRITSNLKDVKKIKSFQYIPKKINIKANSELIKLLVKPLYGGNPTFGVRELLQNSVDTCNERVNIETKKGNKTYEPFIKVSIDRIDDQTSRFTIEDNGVGMSEDIIINYFLNIGASFRDTLHWKKENIDDNGNVQTTRTGRFGIGVLAAFLLGNEIEVETTHLYEQITYSFKTTIDTQNIEVSKIKPKKETGTKISILLTEEQRDLLIGEKQKATKWTNWYVEDTPRIDYILDEVTVARKKLIEGEAFNDIECSDFGTVRWKCSNKKNYIVCNGFVVTTNSAKETIQSDGNIIIQMPSIVLNDSKAMLPLQLDRSDIDCQVLPFENQLYVEMCKEFIAFILTLDEVTTRMSNSFTLYTKSYNTRPIFTQNGYSIASDYFAEIIKKEEKNKLISFIGDMKDMEIKHEDGIFLYYDSIYFNETVYDGLQVSLPCKGRVITIKTELYNNDMFNNESDFKGKYQIEEINGIDSAKYFIFNYDNYDKESIMPSYFKYLSENSPFPSYIQELDFDFFKIRQGGKILNDLLAIYIGDNAVIPYDMEERKNLYPRAFKELQPFMKKLQQTTSFVAR